MLHLSSNGITRNPEATCILPDFSGWSSGQFQCCSVASLQQCWPAHWLVECWKYVGSACCQNNKHKQGDPNNAAGQHLGLSFVGVAVQKGGGCLLAASALGGVRVQSIFGGANCLTGLAFQVALRRSAPSSSCQNCKQPDLCRLRQQACGRQTYR